MFIKTTIRNQNHFNDERAVEVSPKTSNTFLLDLSLLIKVNF